MRTLFRKSNCFVQGRKLKFVSNQAKERMCAYQGVKNVHFLENLVCFVFLKHPF